MENMAEDAKAELSAIINSDQVANTVDEHSYPKFTELAHAAQDSLFPHCEFPSTVTTHQVQEK